MVNSVTSLTGNGLKDWLIQRISALVIAIYSVFLLVFICFHTPLTYSVWSALFHHEVMRIASMLMLLALSLHAWVGVWTVTTDYIKCYIVRLVLQVAVVLFLLICFIWGISMIWGQ